MADKVKVFAKKKMKLRLKWPVKKPVCRSWLKKKQAVTSLKNP